jgi:hypothetical protein
VGEPGAQSISEGNEAADLCDSLLASAEEKRLLARKALGQLQDSVEQARAINPEDIGLLADYGKAVSEARDALAPLVAGEASIGTLDQMHAAAEQLRISTRQETENVFEALRTIANAPVPEGGPDFLASCRSRAARLAGLDSITADEDARLAEGLIALVRLNETASEEKRNELTARAMELLPADCQAAVGSAAFGKLELPPLEEPKEPEEAEPTPEPPPPPPEAREEAEPEPLTAADRSEAEEDEAEPEVVSEAEVEAALGQLLRERRFGLAHWIVVATPDGDLTLERSLKAVAYAASLRSSAGDAASRFRELIQSFPLDSLRGNKAANVLALVAGLRGTLLAPYSGAGDLLGAVSSSYSDHPKLATLIEAVTSAGQRGLSAADMTDQVQNIVSVEDSLRAVQERAENMLRLSTIKYARASNVWRKWIEPEGLLGLLLHPVAENEAAALQNAEESVIALRNARTLEKHLDETDRLLRAATRQRRIYGDARKKLIERAEESLAIVADWIEVSRELERVRQKEANESWQKDLLENLRAAARNAKEEVRETWATWCDEDDLRAAAAAGTLPLVEEIFALVLDGMSPTGDEGPVDEILGVDLLRVRGLGLDERLDPTDELSLRALLGAVNAQDWKSAFEERVAEGNFDAAERIVEVLGRQDVEMASALDKRRLNRLAEKRAHLEGRHDELERRLGAARREGRVSDSDGLILASRLTSLEPRDDQQDFRSSDGTMDEFLEDLKQAEAEGEKSARAIYGKRLAEDPLLQPHRERLQSLLDRGEISTLEELVLAIEREEDLPEEADLIFKQLTEFFPAVAADLRVSKAGQDVEALAAAISEQQGFGALDFASLKNEEVEPVLAAIEAWRRLDCGDLENAEEDLERILDLIGLTVEQGVDSKIWRKRGADKRRRGEFGAKPLGKALVPAFGSDAPGGRYRLLMIWERMSDDAIAALISQEDGEQPIIVLSFGTALPENVRRGVADQLRHQPNRRAVALIDGPAFLYLASKGGRNLATTMRITLPFSAVNPYTPFAPGSVPLEMFYGRDRELSGVIDRNGTSFIYGGRRLGKSALLRAAERKFHAESSGHRAFYVDLKTKGIGEREAADKIVVEIAKALKDKVMTFSSAKDPTFEDIRTQVQAWLEMDSNRRILLLLDECDSFLNADAKDDFPNVTELKALMEETDRRFKPVFAGLHQVRRFQRIPNQPLAHLGYPTPVGPLKPQPAYDLIAKPLEALGLKFETPDLPTRILTATNYQPSLIQLFCSELVDYMLAKACGPGTPPYIVTSQDVEAVHHTPRVVEEMRTRFELTTNLDPRYRVIANSVAFEALGSEATAGLTASEIRAMCDEYWPVGFAKTSSDEFRALLEEMDSLGVLFTDGEGRYLMRSPNVLRMLGTAEQIEEHLKASNELDLPLGFEAASFRDALGADPYRRQPFTHEQVAGLTAVEEEEGEGEQSQLRIVVGSSAAGIEDVMPCLAELFEDGSGKFSFKDHSPLEPKRLRGRFKGAPKKRRRVVAYKLKPGPPSEALSLIRSIGEKIAQPDARSTVIFVLENGSLPIWEALVVPEEHVDDAANADGAADRLEVIELKRWSKPGLRAWAQAQDVDLLFNEDRSLSELVRVTGGWPMLVDQVVKSYVDKHDWREAIDGLEQWLDSPDGAKTLCQAIGLVPDSPLAEIWKLFMVYNEPIAREEFPILAEDNGVEDAARGAELLRSMQVLELDAKGRYVVEETAARAWRRAWLATRHAAS